LHDEGSAWVPGTDGAWVAGNRIDGADWGKDLFKLVWVQLEIQKARGGMSDLIKLIEDSAYSIKEQRDRHRPGSPEWVRLDTKFKEAWAVLVRARVKTVFGDLFPGSKK
jgi:hypothetical protein